MSPNVPLLAKIDAFEGPLSLVDLWSADSYAAARPGLLRQVIAYKGARRVRVGAHCSMVFETRASVWFQIHEELHLHAGNRLQRARDLLTEYVDLVPMPGELRATLFLECGEVSLARELSLLLARHIEQLSVQCAQGRFLARPLESLAQGIPGLTFLRFVRDESSQAEPPCLHWPVPGYMVLTVLESPAVQALDAQLGRGPRITMARAASSQAK